MIGFPSGFSDTTQPLRTEQLDEAGAAALQLLQEKGCEIHVGLTPELADQILATSQEPSIREYCPRDSAERFANHTATEHWLSKKRAVFLLFKGTASNRQLVGYGWSGWQTSPEVPGGHSTFALRIGEAGQGQGLATPFAQAILSASANVYGTSDMWLETWASNGAAVHIYHKLGFEEVSQKSDQRPTASGGTVPDTRLYMTAPDSKLPVRLSGMVTRFKGNGRKLGYPTANLITTTNLKDGVYFGWADLADWQQQPALIFIGTPTTLGDTERRVEVYLLDIPDKDYYDLPLRVTIQHYHRPNQTFPNVDDLLKVMHADEATARQWFAVS